MLALKVTVVVNHDVLIILFMKVLLEEIQTKNVDRKKGGGTLIDDGGGKSFGKEIMLTVWDRHSVHS